MRVSVGVLGPGAHKVLFETSECLWWVWGLILNAISPLLPPCWGLSFAVGHGVSFFGCIQHSPVDGCSAASCNFGVLTGENKHVYFYSAIFCVPSILIDSLFSIHSIWMCLHFKKLAQSFGLICSLI